MAKLAELDAIALLKADHRKVEELFAEFESAKGKASKEKLAKTICTELIVHTIIEEEIFYPACEGEIEENVLNEAYVEHDGAKVLIAEILAGDATSEFYDAKVKVLSEMIKHHVKEEEKRAEGMFAQAKAAGLDVEALGQELAARKQAVMAEIKSNGLPTPTTRSYSGARLKTGKPEHAAAA
ncbi:MAG TPA: hemerythrin domain-containing protein [Terriglobia bacterium]|nr:hemerythrin domain-containing protein [Terriglobia bacterium]